MKGDQTLISHLSELRRRILWTLTCFVVSIAIGFYFSPSIFTWIKHQPATIHITWNVFSLTDGLFIYMRCAFIIAFLITLPVLLYHIWSFVKPGLTQTEIKNSFWYIPMSAVLFIIGSLFAYYVVFPMMIRFMTQMNQSIGATETYGLDRYFGFMFNVIIPLGIAFVMPVVVLFLTKIGILHPRFFRKTRKFAYLGLVIIGSMISPPDFISHISVTIPLIILFEISVLLSSWQIRRTKSNIGGNIRA